MNRILVYCVLIKSPERLLQTTTQRWVTIWSSGFQTFLTTDPYSPQA